MAAAAGVAAAVATDRAARRLGSAGRAVALGWGLVGAAAVYPMARIGRGGSGVPTGELLAVASYGAVGVLAVRRANSDGHLIAGAGWLLHALFDAVHESGSDSHLPEWYPALCAGFDVAIAGLLAARSAG